MRRLVAVPILCLCGIVIAQSSPSYRLDEYTLNAGGNPQHGLTLHSPSYRMSLGTAGGALVAETLRGATRSMDVGFSRSFPPPGEVRQLVALGDKRTWDWAAERSVGTYRVYGGDLLHLPADPGTCKASGLLASQVLLDEEPGSGRTFFYLVTAENSLIEEGTTGYDSAGVRRADPVPCP